MKAIGLITEYNPFHNGHLYHLNEAKKIDKDAAIILVMSGSFMQRGEPSIINKWDKTKIALFYGADIVIELPFVFASQSADNFAKGSIFLLKEMQADMLVFGSESNDAKSLKESALLQLFNKEYQTVVKKHLSAGLSYPSALSKGLESLNIKKVSTPNDILGISYIKEIIKQNAQVKYQTIKRTNDYHSTELDSDIVSATSIRKALNDGTDVKRYVPDETYKYLTGNLHFNNDYFTLIKYKINTDNDLSKYLTVDEGIENRLIKYINESTNIDEFISKVKTKRYTYNKIRRMLTHILIGLTKEDNLSFEYPEYIRLLGFTKKGQKYLSEVKKNLSVPVITNIGDKKNKMLDYDIKASFILESCSNETFKNEIIRREYKEKPIIK